VRQSSRFFRFFFPTQKKKEKKKKKKEKKFDFSDDLGFPQQTELSPLKWCYFITTDKYHFPNFGSHFLFLSLLILHPSWTKR
jgi:hypothetical protein